MSSEADDDDDIPEVHSDDSVPAATQKSVQFTQPLAVYAQDIDELIDFSSSDLDSDHEDDPAWKDPPTASTSESTRGRVKSTYLERNDYKALMDSLKAINQHDTAKHLMMFSLVKQIPARELRQYASKPYRTSWTRWPVKPEPLSSTLTPEDELKEELGALIHRTMYKQLREEGKTISDEDLPPSILDPATKVLQEQLTSLIIRMSILSGADTTAHSTLERFPPLSYQHVLRSVLHTGLMSHERVTALAKKCDALFGLVTRPSDVLLDSKTEDALDFHRTGKRKRPTSRPQSETKAVDVTDEQDDMDVVEDDEGIAMKRQKQHS